eukprot:TRINITY_DN1588_c0_g1_i1.p2 TRINITY_DN1588_c0_g1~~TRINITY_DN1588_c0_g1_i1.p2  ORF type:complete len:136 (-),score=36.78 TRINITY_DN1588_c0_g1_i1:35-442(-)
MAHESIRKVVVQDPSQFDSTIASLQNDAAIVKNLYVLVTGAVDPATGHSWCPDCVRADPVIMNHLSNIEDVTLVECPVLRANYRGNPQYPYRVHPQLRLQAVPTLYRWGKNGPVRSLVEDQCADAGLLEALTEEL